MDSQKYIRALAIVQNLGIQQKKSKENISLGKLHSIFADEVYESDYYCKLLIQKMSEKRLISVQNVGKIQFFVKNITESLNNLTA